ncbi:MAG TPA: [protein-PII] uridylyltransferase, partial [Polyangiaceae bacterium]|nr:[protein-PII] uridylyltransferase [Polyangiaceae bacterium]
TQLGDDKVWSTLSLAAVGSYGRGGFGFKSDLDVRVLCKSQKKASQIADAYLYPLWDAGIQVGHQIVTQSSTIQLAKSDLATATTLLDWRHLAGDQAASAELQEKAFATLFAPGNVQEFLARLGEQAEERWNRFGDSVYLLEPDVKLGQGGLRDLDIAHWTALSRWRVRSLKGLVNIGVLLPREFEQLDQAANFLRRVRNVLHYNTRRRTERLGFEQQELVADRMGYGSGGPGCEALMSDYYLHARTIANVRELLLARAEPPPKKRQKAKSLGNGLQLLGDAVALEDPDRLQAEPALALRLYWEAVHRDLPVFRLSRDAILRATTGDDFCERLRQSEEAARLFRRLVRVVRKVRFKRNSLLTELHDVGLVLAMIPEFKPVVGRVHHDIYHVYTVDAHSIAAVDRMRALVRGELSAEHPIASRLGAEIARPHVLFMAALLHDIGKDIGGRQHSERGVELCRVILNRLGVAEHDIVEIQHLVLKHLRMYHVASRRDIDDPGTIESFRAEVHGPEGLKELYLLTLCDVATTSPQALTSWKERMMEELYVRTLRSFEGMPARTEARAESLREAARALCPASGERAFLEHFLSVVPDRYLYANEPEDIVAHSRLARQSQTRRFMTTVLTHDAPYSEVGFITDDKPGALAMITAVLAANRLRVVGAQLYSWVDEHGRRRVLDLFWVRGADDPASVARALPRVESDFEKLLGGEISADQLIEQRRGSKISERPAPDVPTTIIFDNRSAHAHTIIEVAAHDRPGLLYRLAKTLANAGLEVALAKINTEGNAVADVFYVSDHEGKKLTEANQVEELHHRLREAAQRNTL